MELLGSSGRGGRRSFSERKLISDLGGHGTPQKELLHFESSQFDQETWKCMESVVQEANRILWHWKTFPIILPPPIESRIEPQHGNSMSMKKKTLNMRDLFVMPNFNEVATIGLNARGGLKRLTKEQLKSVRQTGEFEVDSIEFPGQKHRWIITQLLIKGKEKTYNTLLDNMAHCAYLIVGLTRTCCLHIADGLNGWSMGIQNLLQMIFGTPLLDIVGLEAKLLSERSKYLVAELKEASGEEGKAQALANFFVEKQRAKEQNRTGSQNQQEKAPLVPYRFLTHGSQGLEIDLRLCNRDIIGSAKPHLLHILNTAMQDWIPERRHELIKQYKIRGIENEDDIAFNLTKDVTDEYYSRVCKLIQTDQGIDRLGECIANLLVGQAQTAKIIQEVLNQDEKNRADHQTKVEQELKQDNPLLSRVGSWLHRQKRAADADYVDAWKWRPHEEAIKLCKTAGLEQSAYFLTKDLSFRKDHEPMWTKELRKLCKSPAREFTFKMKIWNPKSWVVTENIAGESRVTPTKIQRPGDDTVTFKRPGGSDIEDGLKLNVEDSSSVTANPTSTVSYSLSKNTVRTTHSGCWGWRWLNFFHRTNSICWNTLFYLGIVIPWCSALSLRALFYTEPFYPNYVLDQKTGILQKDRRSETWTVISRIDSLWNHISQKRKDFESKPDTGLMSKDVVRVVHKFVQYVLKGAIGTLLILLLFPISMLVVSSLSLFLAILSPPFIWTLSAIVHLVVCLFLDFEGKVPFGGLVTNILVNIVGRGTLGPMVLAFLGFIVSPAVAIVGAVMAVVRKVLRDAWDTVIFRCMIGNCARVPLSDNFLARRIAGPGMASTYYFQIKTEQALAALETAMDLDRLQVYHTDVSRQIKQPMDDYKKFVNRFFSPFGPFEIKASSKEGGAVEKLRSETKAFLDQLDEKVKLRTELLSNKLSTGMRSRIRLSEMDLKTVLHHGTIMVEKFYVEQVMTRMTETEVQKFWSNKQLKKKDWLSLTSYLLSDLFSPEFMIPLQTVDTTFALKVKHWNLGRYMNMVLEDEWHDDLDVTRVIQTPKIQSFTGQPDIPLESFNPSAHSDAPTSKERKVWLLHKRAKTGKAATRMLSNPLPLPHPIRISLIISNRDTFTQSQLKLDKMSFNSMLRLIQESRSISSDMSLSSPTSPNKLSILPETEMVKNNQRAASTLKEEDPGSMAEMDPAMASLTQSLEELDRDLDSNSDLERNRGGKNGRLCRDHNINNSSPMPGLRKSGPGSVPLLASTEDISIALMKSHKQKELEDSPGKTSKKSYSTVV